MKLKFSGLISAIAILCAPAFSSAEITQFDPQTDCKKLDAPHTVLIVHATWCYWCQQFMPVAKIVSNIPKYQSWTFYEVADDKGLPVCGKEIDGFPKSFVKNINGQNSIISGYQDEETLKKSLDDADVTTTCFIAKK